MTTRPGPPTVLEMVEFLQREGVESQLHGDGAATIAAVAALDDAADGQLGWLSPKRCQVGWPDFAGSALVAPAPPPHTTAYSVITTPTPKLAFIRIAGEFFAHLAEVHFESHNARAGDARIADTARIAFGVVIGPNVVIGEDVVVGPNTVLANCIIGARTKIGANCTIGLPGFGYERGPDGRLWRFPHMGIVRIGADVELGSNTCVDRGTLGATEILDGAKIDNLVHVAHNVRIGRDAVVIAHAMLGGSATIGDAAWIAPSASLMNQCHVGDRATVGLGAVVLKSVEADAVVVGNPAKVLKKS
jgi:UDP-3-O-[3-hydroxymyristoyl] glucosamine N-acyltransferase